MTFLVHTVSWRSNRHKSQWSLSPSFNEFRGWVNILLCLAKLTNVHALFFFCLSLSSSLFPLSVCPLVSVSILFNPFPVHPRLTNIAIIFQSSTTPHTTTTTLTGKTRLLLWVSSKTRTGTCWRLCQNTCKKTSPPTVTHSTQNTEQQADRACNNTIRKHCLDTNRKDPTLEST